MPTSNDLSDVGQKISIELDFDFLGKVGEGAYKETFHILNKDSEPLALKVYRTGVLQERTAREITSMQRCDHPNIAKLYSIDSIIIDGQEYLYAIEEFLGGGTLSSRLKAQGLFDLDSILTLGAQLISAISHIEPLKLVHRDIKPDNILFRETADEAVLSDFGIVRDLEAESITQTWAIPGPGTPFYSAPEQLLNQKTMINWRTDQFSLGVLLSECVFGIHPFTQDNENPVAIIQKVASRVPLSMGFIERCSEYGLPALAIMVAPWPANRYRTPEDLFNVWTQQGV